MGGLGSSSLQAISVEQWWRAALAHRIRAGAGACRARIDRARQPVGAAGGGEIMGTKAMRRHLRRSVALAAAVAACGMAAPLASAATDNWLGASATTPTWDQPTNW